VHDESVSTSDGPSRAAQASRWIFLGMAVGAAVKFAVSLAFLLPGEIGFALPVLPHAELAIEVAPALLGVGYILGYRQSAVCVSGGLISALVLTPLIAWFGSGLQAPLYPETQRLIADMSSGDIWSRYVRYIGAGAVATAGILTVLRSLRRWPTRSARLPAARVLTAACAHTVAPRCRARSVICPLHSCLVA
jgi:uncharacterized oligopeptide transporter (OPT) family protein